MEHQTRRAVASGADFYVDVFWYGRHGGFVGCGFEFRAGMKGHYAAGWNVHHDACFWIATGSRYFVAEPEVAEPCEFDGVTALERIADFREEGLDHVFGFPLVEADVLEHEFGEFCFGQRWATIICNLLSLGWRPCSR